MLLSFGNLARKTDAMLFRKHLIDRNQRRANQSFNSCLKNKYQEIFTMKLLKLVSLPTCLCDNNDIRVDLVLVYDKKV